MKKLLVLSAVVLLVALAGCGKSPNSPEPDPLDATEGVFAAHLFNITSKTPEGFQGWYFLINGEVKCPIEWNGNGFESYLDPMERDTDNVVTLHHANGDTVRMNVDGQEVKSFIVRLNTGTPLRYLTIPQSIVALGKPVIPTTGGIRVESTPPGATVYLDGVEVGVTPYKDEITPGSHTLKIVLEGYEDKEEKVVIKAGETAELSLELRVYLPHGFDPDQVPWEGTWINLYDGEEGPVITEWWNGEFWITGFGVPFRKVGKQLIPSEHVEATIDNIYAYKDAQGYWRFSYNYNGKPIAGYRKK